MRKTPGSGQGMFPSLKINCKPVQEIIKPSQTAVKQDSNVAVLVRRVHHFDTAIKAKIKKKKPKNQKNRKL